jgi:hypothetical protein
MITISFLFLYPMPEDIKSRGSRILPKNFQNQEISPTILALFFSYINKYGNHHPVSLGMVTGRAEYLSFQEQTKATRSLCCNKRDKSRGFGKLLN